MKIVSWNLNSIRARQERLLTYLGASAPDVLCLQELKCEDAQFPDETLRAAGYHSAWHGQRTYNGVALCVREGLELTDVRKGFDDGDEDAQSRVLSATVQGTRILCVYAPNGQEVGSPAYEYKLLWFKRLRRYLETHHQPSDPLVLCGDFNVAPEPIDVHDPVEWEGQTLFSLPEREALKDVVAFGFEDLFRKHHPEPGKYSWWDYRMLGFPKNRGLRIDHVFGTPEVAARCLESEIDREMRKGKQPSDHAPVWVRLGG